MSVQLVRKNGTAYSLKVQDSFTCRVKAALSGNDIQHNVEPKFLVGQISVRILFTATIPDRYSVEVRLNGSLLGGRLATKTYTAGYQIILCYLLQHCSILYLDIAGEMDLTRSKLLNVAEPKIATAKVYFPIQLFARDNFGNAANISENRLQVEVRKVKYVFSYQS